MTKHQADTLRRWQAGELGRLQPGPDPKQAIERLKRACEQMQTSAATLSRLFKSETQDEKA